MPEWEHGAILNSFPTSSDSSSGQDLSENSSCGGGDGQGLRKWSCSGKGIQTPQEDNRRVPSPSPGSGSLAAINRQCFLWRPRHPAKNVDQAQEEVWICGSHQQRLWSRLNATFRGRLALAQVHRKILELRTGTEPPSPLLVAGPNTSSFLTLAWGMES